MGWEGGGRGVVVRRSGDDEKVLRLIVKVVKTHGAGALGGLSQQLQRERHKTMALHECHNMDLQIRVRVRD